MQFFANQTHAGTQAKFSNSGMFFIQNTVFLFDIIIINSWTTVI